MRSGWKLCYLTHFFAVAMSLWLNFIFGRNFSLIEAFICCVSVVTLFAYVIRRIEWTSFVHAIKYEVQLWQTVIKWYAQTFPKGKTRLEQVFEVFDIAQPTPYKVRNLLAPTIYIDKPEDLQIILNHANALEKSSDVYRLLGTLLADSLVAAPVSEWKWRRRHMMPFFNTHSLRTYSHVMYKKSRLELEKLQTWANTEKELDLWDFMIGLTTDMVTETLLGLDPELIYTESDRHRLLHDVKSGGELFMSRVLHIWLHPDIVYAVVGRFNGWFRVVKNFNNFVVKVIRHKRKMSIEAAQKGTNPANATWLDSLSTKYSTKDGEDVSPLLIQDVALMYSAGSETSAMSECYTLLMLAMNPHIQDQLHSEIDEVLGTEDDERPITVDQVENMPLLGRCIKESLRLFPVISAIVRRLTASIKLSDGEVADKGTNVIVCPYHVHRKRELYDDPLTFDPDRFLPEKVQARHPYSYIPFSAGPRGCIGYKYAMISMKIVLATIMRKYRVTTDMKMNDIKHNLDLVLRSSDGWKVKIYSRR